MSAGVRPDGLITTCTTREIVSPKHGAFGARPDDLAATREIVPPALPRGFEIDEHAWHCGATALALRDRAYRIASMSELAWERCPLTSDLLLQESDRFERWFSQPQTSVGAAKTLGHTRRRLIRLGVETACAARRSSESKWSYGEFVMLPGGFGAEPLPLSAPGRQGVGLALRQQLVCFDRGASSELGLMAWTLCAWTLRAVLTTFNLTYVHI